MNKVVIVGCGNVGMAYAYAIAGSNSAVDELVLIDINSEKAMGEAMDLCHANIYAPKHISIKSGTYADCKDAKIVCICAGRNQNEGETRDDLICKNFAVFNNVVSSVKKSKFKGIFLIATNPLDTMTYITKRLSGFEGSRVVGSGTTLDTARLKHLIANKLQVNPKDVNAYVLGEHGDSEFVDWDNATIGGNNCKNMLTKNERSTISYEVRMSAYDIINKKGNTSYGIGMCLLTITNAILNDENTILTVSCYDEKLDIYYSVPAIIGKDGIKHKVPLKLSKEGINKLTNCVDTLQKSRNAICSKLK